MTNKILIHAALTVVMMIPFQSMAAGQIVHEVDFPKGDAAWSVNFELAAAAQATPSNPKAAKPPKQRKQIDIVRKGDLRHDVVTWTDGSVTDYWWGPVFVAYQDDPQSKVTLMKTGNMGDHRYDESLFSWISKETFVSMQSFKGKTCRYYTMKITLPSGDQMPIYAWIDDTTLRPVAWGDGGINSIFTFDEPLPLGALAIPPKFQKEIDRIQAYFVFPKRTPAAGQ